MLLQALATLLLPALLLAAPTSLSERQWQKPACTPTSYAVTSFTLSPTPGTEHIHFVFKSTFSDPSIIDDAATAGATCDAVPNADGTFPSSSACSTGSRDLEFYLAGPLGQAKYQVAHTWMCEGRTWMSSTPLQMEDLDCREGGECTSPGQSFVPANVRPICGMPTCP